MTKGKHKKSAVNRSLINLIIIGFCVWLSAGCATRNSPTVTFHDKYDSGTFDAIQKNWSRILDEQKFAMDRFGKVVVQFHINSNGTVSDVKIIDNNVGEVLGYDCEEAIYKAAPFKPWSSDVKTMTGKDYREITFTFNYK